MALNDKQEAFIESYLICFNRTQAAKEAGYSAKTAGSQGARLLKNVEIANAISERMRESAMSADEVLKRLAEHARGDIGDFIHLSSDEIRQSNRSRLIKKFTRTITTTTKNDYESVTESLTLELYDAQAALEKIGRHHKLFTDKTEIAGEGGGPIPIAIVKPGLAKMLLDD